jgi:3-isopropylmalate/(R)-2-methylmalate dehydratase large subunit
MGMTIAEKILARASGRKSVAAGDLVTVRVDTTVLFDNNFMPNNWPDVRKVDYPERVVVILDHRVPAPTIQAAGAHVTARKFVEQFGIERFHDVGQHQGICHQVVADEAPTRFPVPYWYAVIRIRVVPAR